MTASPQRLLDRLAAGLGQDLEAIDPLGDDGAQAAAVLSVDGLHFYVGITEVQKVEAEDLEDISAEEAEQISRAQALAEEAEGQDEADTAPYYGQGKDDV
jgi:hypothetical protein